MTITKNAIACLVIYSISTYGFILTARSSSTPNNKRNSPEPLLSLPTISPSNISTVPSLSKMPPRRFDYIHEIYNVSIYRNPTTGAHYMHNPSVSLDNWNIAVLNATTALETACHTAGLKADDAIPDGQWNFAVPLHQQAARSRGRSIKQVTFELMDAGGPAKLTFREVGIVLLGLYLYGEEWDGGDRGINRVRMCMIELRIPRGGRLYEDVLVASGGVGLIDPSMGDGEGVGVVVSK